MLNIQTAAMEKIQAQLAELTPSEQSLIQSIEEQLAIAIQQQIAVIFREQQQIAAQPTQGGFLIFNNLNRLLDLALVCLDRLAF